MISLRSSLTFIPVALIGFALAACDRAPDATQPLRPGGGAFDDKGNSAKDGSVSARILLAKDSTGVLEFRTGTFNDASGVGAFNGVFDQIHYKVYNGKKQIFDRTIHFKNDDKNTGPNFYSESFDLCKHPDHNDGDNDDVPCFSKFDATNYIVTVEANIRGVNGDPKQNDVVRDTLGEFQQPDVDLKGNGLQMVQPDGTIIDPGQVSKDAAQTYQVPFSNEGGILPTVAVIATCEVHILDSNNNDVTPSDIQYFWKPNGQPVVAAGIGGVSQQTTIPAGQTSVCQFKTALHVVGTYTVRVTGHAVSPADFNPDNNTVQANIQIINGTPVQPVPGGFGRNATAADFQYYDANFQFLGDSAQRASIENLSAVVLANSDLSGTFTLTVHFYTVDSTAGLPFAHRDLANVSWTGSLSDLVSAAAAATANNNCVPVFTPTGTFGTLTMVSPNANGNTLTPSICVVASGNQLNVGVNVLWSAPRATPTSPAPLVAATNGAVQFGDYLFYDTNLSFSAQLAGSPVVSHAPVKLTPSITSLPPGAPFNAKFFDIQFH